MKVKMFLDLQNGIIIDDVKTLVPIVNITVPVMSGYTRYVFEVELPDRHFMDMGHIDLGNIELKEVSESF